VPTGGEITPIYSPYGSDVGPVQVWSPAAANPKCPVRKTKSSPAPTPGTVITPASTRTPQHNLATGCAHVRQQRATAAASTAVIDGDLRTRHAKRDMQPQTQPLRVRGQESMCPYSPGSQHKRPKSNWLICPPAVGRYREESWNTMQCVPPPPLHRGSARSYQVGSERNVTSHLGGRGVVRHGRRGAGW
jgi:hypothetical protein